MTAEYGIAGPTLDDIFDLRTHEIGDYRDWCDLEGLDPWSPAAYLAWKADA